MARVRVFKDIDELVTLDQVYRKEARQITEQDISVIKKGAIISIGGKVAWTGRTSQLSSRKICKLLEEQSVDSISLSGQTVLPGFVECHTHSVFAGDRSAEFEQRNLGVSYQEIAKQGGGILSTVSATRKGSQERLLKLAQQRIDRFTQQGVTTVEVKSGYGLSKASEMKMLRVIRKLKGPKVVSTFLGPHGVPLEFSSATEYLEELITQTLPKVAQQKLADRVDMFVEQGYFSCADARRWIEAAQYYGLKSTLHVDQLTQNRGSLVGVEMGIQSVDHLVQIQDPEIKRISKSQVTAVLLPGADMYLKMNYPPARQLIEAGARVAIATDYNPGSCPTQDLSLIGVLSRLEMAMSLPEVLSAYTQGAAYALGLEDECGSLSVGKVCDFITVNGSWRELFYQVGHHPVTSVWRSGKRLKSKK